MYVECVCYNYPVQTCPQYHQAVMRLSTCLVWIVVTHAHTLNVQVAAS